MIIPVSNFIYSVGLWKKNTNLRPKRKGSVSYPYTGLDSPLSL
jgi:hypothetical protein